MGVSHVPVGGFRFFHFPPARVNARGGRSFGALFRARRAVFFLFFHAQAEDFPEAGVAEDLRVLGAEFQAGVVGFGDVDYVDFPGLGVVGFEARVDFRRGGVVLDGFERDG